jgi:thioester reductase-like protein
MDLFLTGGTGLVGRRTLARLLRAHPDLHAFVLVRHLDRWRQVAGTEGIPETRVTPLTGDLVLAGLGLDASAMDALRHRVTTVLHCAADTMFSNPLPDARRVNTVGTGNVLQLVSPWPHLRRFLHVSTAFVVGRRVGRILEREYAPDPGFVNYYEQSKYEAEQLVRASARPWVIIRPSTIVCDSNAGNVSQFNAVHRSLRLYHSGLAPMLPGEATNTVDFVTTEYVAGCIAALVDAPGIESRTFHVCAGAGAIPLGSLLDIAQAVWAESDEWRRRSIPAPALTDLKTYELFERTVRETADARLRAITKSLSHFVPQLSLPKTFDVSGTESVMGRPPIEVSVFWEPMVRHLIRTRWAASIRRAA